MQTRTGNLSAGGIITSFKKKWSLREDKNGKIFSRMPNNFTEKKKICGNEADRAIIISFSVRRKAMRYAFFLFFICYNLFHIDNQDLLTSP